MAETQIESVAFQQARLRSERYRTIIVVCAVVLITFLHSSRMLLLHTHEDRLHLLYKAVLVVSFVCYKTAILSFVKTALKAGRHLPSWIWISDIVIETSLPAFGIAFLTSSVIAPSYRPIANPLTLTFFLFIILSVLRLNPWASLLSGGVAGFSYLVASWYLGWRPHIYSHASIQSPERTVFSYALELFIAGGVAGAIAWEVRNYVQAALREAETRRQMERLEHDMKVARSIQESLLPANAPQIEGFEIAGWNLPADETGGDFYDWQLLATGKLVVTLADVTGHGIGPAILAAVCRAYARANLGTNGGLLSAMDRINGLLSQDLTPGRFATLVAVICSPCNPRVELLSAGHGPLFVYLFREDRIQSMGAQGLPLGIMPILNSDPPHFIDLSTGDLLVLATDGLSEWENARGEDFGADRLASVIRQTRDCSPRAIIDALYSEVLKFSGGTKQQDDLTIVIIKRT